MRLLMAMSSVRSRFGMIMITLRSLRQHGYHVNVDGRHITYFPYRTDYTLENAIGLTLNGDIDVHSVFAASLPTSHPSFVPQRHLEMSNRWKAPPLSEQLVDQFIVTYEDFDQRIMEYFIKLIKKKHRKDINKDNKTLRKLRRKAERAKRALSSFDFGDSLRKHEMHCRFKQNPPLLWTTINAPVGVIVITLLVGHIFHEVMYRIAKVENDYREMIELNACAEAADIAKSQFLAAVFHEIRTPINGVLIMLKMLMNDKEMNVYIIKQWFQYDIVVGAALIEDATWKLVMTFSRKLSKRISVLELGAILLRCCQNLMDTTSPSGEPTMDTSDWRIQLQPDSRQRIVNKIMDTLKRHLPFSGQEGLNELGKIAVRFEEKIFMAASSQSDYLRRISLKMLAMETKSQNTIPNAGNNSKPPDPASLDSTAQTGHASGGDWQEECYQKTNNMASLHHNSLSSLPGVSTAQQTMLNSLQPGFNLDSGQGNVLGSTQQVAPGP
ncbi:hypothetical protein REPUB_Repub13aG0151700 [Reevesia pubescens]